MRCEYLKSAYGLGPAQVTQNVRFFMVGEWCQTCLGRLAGHHKSFRKPHTQSSCLSPHHVEVECVARTTGRWFSAELHTFALSWFKAGFFFTAGKLKTVRYQDMENVQKSNRQTESDKVPCDCMFV